MDHNYSNLPDDLRDAQSGKWRSSSTSCPGLSVCNDLFRSKNSRRKKTHTHTQRATRSRSSNRRGTWRRLVSLRSEDAKLECLAKAECKGRVYLRREWRGLGPWPRGPSVSMPRGPVPVFATWNTCISARVDWRQCSAVRWLLLETSRIKPLD